jgi:hypothetical protein
VVLARELTKKFEEWLRGTPAELAAEWARRPRKGEFVVMIGPADGDGEGTGSIPGTDPGVGVGIDPGDDGDRGPGAGVTRPA